MIDDALVDRRLLEGFVRVRRGRRRGAFPKRSPRSSPQGRGGPRPDAQSSHADGRRATIHARSPQRAFASHTPARLEGHPRAPPSARRRPSTVPPHGNATGNSAGWCVPATPCAGRGRPARTASLCPATSAARGCIAPSPRSRRASSRSARYRRETRPDRPGSGCGRTCSPPPDFARRSSYAALPNACTRPPNRTPPGTSADGPPAKRAQRRRRPRECASHRMRRSGAPAIARAPGHRRRGRPRRLRVRSMLRCSWRPIARACARWGRSTHPAMLCVPARAVPRGDRLRR